jgi:pimeloyl-ACP methyl ester carboxylesterase
MTQAPLVFFIHGLNTFGDDLFHTGPLAYGPMSKHWKTALEKYGIEFYSLKEMGFGSFDDQVARAIRQINDVRKGRSGPCSIHLLGHSLGGLVARGVAKSLLVEPTHESRHDLNHDSRLRSVMTIGTPHKGSRAQNAALTLRSTSPALYYSLRAIGYDTEKRREPLSHFQNEKILEYDARHPLLDMVDCVSLIGAASAKNLALPLRLIYRKLHPHGDEEPSDGLVPAQSQRWARVAGEFELDHFAQLGAFLQIRKQARQRARDEFERAISTVQDVIRANS